MKVISIDSAAITINKHRVPLPFDCWCALCYTTLDCTDHPHCDLRALVHAPACVHFHHFHDEKGSVSLCSAQPSPTQSSHASSGCSSSTSVVKPPHSFRTPTLFIHVHIRLSALRRIARCNQDHREDQKGSHLCTQIVSSLLNTLLIQSHPGFLIHSARQPHTTLVIHAARPEVAH
jgi:hypothetical protein